jgi:alpha-tubulin suppressor-like RCC1 family protein
MQRHFSRNLQRRPLTKASSIWLAALLVISATLAAACDVDLSCVETATCPPDYVEGGQDGAIDGDSDTLRDAPAKDVAAEAHVTDAGPLPEAGPESPDRLDSGPTSDARDDSSIRPDSAGEDRSDGSQPDIKRDDVRADTNLDADASTLSDVLRDTQPYDARRDAGSETSPPIDADAGASDGCMLNACGGCGTLAGVPGSTCGSCGTYACSADKTSVSCDNDPGFNACGGCGALDGVPGAKCGSCGAYVCNAEKTSVTCDHPDFLKVTQLAAGDSFTCALLATGSVRCWGRNDNGQLGDGTLVDRVRPPSGNIISNVTDFASIEAGVNHICAVRKGGGVRCWGGNEAGQLGNGSTTRSLDALGPDVLGGATAVSASGGYSCALLATGKERCWGYNASGELGDGTSGMDRYTPNVDVLGLAGAVAINGSCALLNHGGMSCWGEGNGGALGDGLGMSSSSPVDVLHLNGISALSAGNLHTCAIVAGGVSCWGSNVFGQCGDGRAARNLYEPPTMPVQLDAVTVGTGSTHTCALLKSGVVRCWGENHSGEVGDGTNTERLTPVDVAGLAGVSAIAAGSRHNCALLATGGIRCWGANAWGQLGDGSRTDRSTPIDVPQMCP